MKIKFTPKLAYFFGLWKARRARSGVSISGSPDTVRIFVREAGAYIEPEKIRVRETKAWFYHATLRKYLQELEEGELERFKWRNPFSANFFAGFIEGCGGIERGGIFFAKASPVDQMVLERLGFRTKFVRGKLFIIRPREFLTFVLPAMQGEEFRNRLSALLRSGNERDHR